jgi:hypothetical protein
MTSLDTNEVHFQKTLNICTFTDKPASGIFLKAMIDNLQKSSNFKFKCPFAKGSNLRIAKFTTKNIFFSLFLPPNTEKSFSLVLKEGKKATPIMAVVIYYMRVEIDD